MIFKIKNKSTGAVIFELDCASMKLTVEAAVAASVNLSYADLRGANLRGVDLSYADLRGANLRGVDLRGAILSYANLRGVDLRGAILSYANLRGVDLSGADLSGVRDDIFDILKHAQADVPYLLEALESGKVDGSCYNDGDGCGCLVGTLAIHHGCNEHGIAGLTPNSSRPAERFFMAIRIGDTPATNPFSKIATEWVREWLAANPIKAAVEVEK